MRRKLIKAAGLLIAMVVGLAGCGNDGGGRSTYVPVTVGSTWSYNRSDNGIQTQKITASANNRATREVVDTTTGKSVATINISDNEYYLASIDLYDTAGVLTATKTYSPSPGQLFFPSITLPGAHVAQNVQVTTLPANTTASLFVDTEVIGAETITVPAGTFTNALKIQTTIAGTTYASWFALNVGMIRQDVNDVTSVELASYSIK